ncbi:MAG: preprotein translocase subunit SecY [bacterium]|nr:preprotein translocase subunit SecY [bacterium]
MLETVRNAFKVKEIRNKLMFTFIALLIVRLGSQIPLKGVDKSAIAQLLGNSDTINFFDAMTGGSLMNFSIFALGISPYITASIIMQLLTICIPSLEEMQKDGEDGRKKITKYTRYMNIGLSIIQATAMVIGFSHYDGIQIDNATGYIVAITALVAGSAFLMWLGDRISEHGVGNGISIILTINIIYKLPQDARNLWTQFVSSSSNMVNSIIAIVVIVGLVVGLIFFINLLNGGERRIPVQYAKKVQGRKMVGGQSSHIPLKVNTAGVIPVIFASSLMQFPVLIASFFGVQPGSGSLGQKILKLLSQNYWFKTSSLSEFKYTLGLVIYIVLLIFFAYFYTTITFNPMEVSNNMKKQGGFVPGIRPGKPTTDFLTRILNSIVLIGAVGLAIIAIIPIVCSGIFGASVNFGGTSLIIIAGVVLETIKQVESQMLVRHYKGFLNE